jgi:hypothetical protein
MVWYLTLREDGSAVLTVGNRKLVWTADDILLLESMLSHIKKGAAAKEAAIRATSRVSICKVGGTND